MHWQASDPNAKCNDCAGTAAPIATVALLPKQAVHPLGQNRATRTRQCRRQPTPLPHPGIPRLEPPTRQGNAQYGGGGGVVTCPLRAKSRELLEQQRFGLHSIPCEAHPLPSPLKIAAGVLGDGHEQAYPGTGGNGLPVETTMDDVVFCRVAWMIGPSAAQSKDHQVGGGCLRSRSSHSLIHRYRS